MQMLPSNNNGHATNMTTSTSPKRPCNFPLPASPGLLQTQLTRPHSRQDTKQRDHRQYYHSPKLNAQRIDIEVCLCRERHRREHEDEDGVAADSVILVKRFGAADGSVHVRGEEHGDAYKGLRDEEDVGDEAEDGVG